MEDRIRELSKYRFETSLENLEDARIMYENGRYKNALNRAYYSIFHAIRSVDALDGFDSSKHSGVISHFNQNHVKTGDFEPETSSVIKRASMMREKSDYEDFYEPEKEDVERTISEVSYFLSAVKEYLKTR